MCQMLLSIFFPLFQIEEESVLDKSRRLAGELRGHFNYSILSTVIALIMVIIMVKLFSLKLKLCFKVAWKESTHS